MAAGSKFQVRTEVDLAHLWGYVKKFGTACVPRVYVCGDGYRLGGWVKVRRQQRGLNPRLDGLLESLPGWTQRAAVHAAPHAGRISVTDED